MTNADLVLLFKKTLPKWAEMLPFESEKFAACLIDAIICSSDIAQVRQNIRVGELLVESKLISSAQFQEALRQSKKLFLPLGRTLLQSGNLTLEQLRNTVKVQLMCRSGVIPADFAGMAIKASFLPLTGQKTVSTTFLETLQSHSRASVTRDDYLPKLITLMDELILAEEKHGMLNTDVALLADKIGDLCYYRAEADEAEAMYRRALKIYEHERETHLEKSANISQKLGRLLIANKKYQEAEQCLLACLQTKSRISGDHSPELYEVLIEIGHLFFSQANYAAAINFLRSAWAIKKDDASPAEKIYLFELLIKCFEQCGQDTEAANFAEQLNLIRRSN